MKKFLITSFIIIICKFSLFGSHIVGGEFELLHLQDFRYRLNMILYFDEINGQAGAKDPTATVYVYRKSDNSRVATFVLNLQTDVLVPYSNSKCNDNQLITARLVYSSEIVLSADLFSDPEGYYVSWERCCRNYNITNIQSNDPATGGIAAGQTFYLEFPPVMKNGEPFVNSTPRLFPPLSDYGCVDKFYFVDFGGADDDGDSLSYTLVTPYSTVSPEAIPATPNSGPYPDVVYKSGFGIDNVIGGDPDLAISSSGLLTVTPKSIGLYVFAVKCEEFRDGVKLGEMRRDFQMLVVSNCANENPTIKARELGSSDFYVESETLNFSNEDEDKCIEILVTDQPVSGEVTENVTVRAIPINFNAELEGIEITATQNIPIRNELDTARFTVCFPQCPFTRSGFYQIGIIGYDDACPQPALDTVIVSLNIPPPPNQNAYYANAKGGNKLTTLTRNVVQSANGSIALPISVFDDDNDELSLIIQPLGFDLEDVGMEFTEPVFDPGKVNTTLNWSYDCNADNLNFSGGRDVSTGNLIRKAFDVLLIAEDADMCEWEDPQTLLITMIIDFPNQTKPKVYREGLPNADFIKIEHVIGESLEIPVKAEDMDGDLVLLQGFGTDFNFNDFGINFPAIQGNGVPGFVSNFVWPTDCQFDLSTREVYNMRFLVEDQDDCQLTNTDTLAIEITFIEPVNSAPNLSFSNFSNLTNVNDTLLMTLGQNIDAVVSAKDFQNDSISLKLIRVSPEVSGFSFENIGSKNEILKPFVWTPTCDVFTDDSYSEDVTFVFLVQDFNCREPLSDSLKIVVHIEDIISNNEFIPANFFSPNGDVYNEFFGPYKREEIGDGQLGELVNILPIDNCAGIFQGVVIYNRWGKIVYESTDRDFKWYGKDNVSGVYFYQIKFSNRDYKGSVTMIN